MFKGTYFGLGTVLEFSFWFVSLFGRRIVIFCSHFVRLFLVVSTAVCRLFPLRCSVRDMRLARPLVHSAVDSRWIPLFGRYESCCWGHPCTLGEHPPLLLKCVFPFTLSSHVGLFCQQGGQPRSLPGVRRHTEQRVTQRV